MPRLKAPWNERNGRFSVLKAIVFVLLFAPAAWIVFQAATGMLDPKPVTEMIHRAGDWAVRLMLLSLLVTPLRRFAQWPKLIAVRRMVGVAAFAYAFAHLSLYVVDQKLNLPHVAAEIALRFYLTIGFAAWLGLAALSATSTDAMIRCLGAARWNRLHKLVYAIAALAIFHYYLQSKLDVSQPVLMMGLYFILMLARLLQKRDWPAWGVVIGSAFVAPPATALVEATWYAIVRHIDFWEVLGANFDPDMSPRPSHTVALAGLAFIIVYAARNWRLWKTSAVLAGAEQERRHFGDARRLVDRERGGAADRQRGKADARGEQAVEHAFAHARRDA
jgi:sulfoxide reductase heme-binding subunit YedZ